MPSPRVHLVLGSDEYRVSAYVKALIDRLVPPAARTLGLETFDGNVDTVDLARQAIRQAVEAVKTPSFLGGNKVVWLREPAFLGGPKIEDAKRLAPMLDFLRSTLESGIPEEHVLVLSGSAIARNHAIVHAIERLARQGLADVQAFDAIARGRNADRDAAAIVAEAAAKDGRKLSGAVCAALVARVGMDTRLLHSELQKLLMSVGDREPTTEDVLAVVTPTRGGEVWDLQDAFGERNLPATLTVLERLVDTGVAPILLFMQLIARVNDLLIVRDSLDRRFATGAGGFAWAEGLPDETAQAVKACDARWNPVTKHPFVREKLVAQARNYRRLELRKARQILVHAYERSVDTGSTPAENRLAIAVAEATAPDA